MTTQPKPALLITRICDALESTILADPAPERAQRQIKAALWALRRIAAGLDQRSELVSADIDDMQRVLAAHGECPEAEMEQVEADEERHIRLQARVAALEASAFTPGTPACCKQVAIAADLRALYGRMLDRERRTLGTGETSAA